MYITLHSAFVFRRQEDNFRVNFSNPKIFSFVLIILRTYTKRFPKQQRLGMLGKKSIILFVMCYPNPDFPNQSHWWAKATESSYRRTNSLWNTNISHQSKEVGTRQGASAQKAYSRFILRGESYNGEKCRSEWTICLADKNMLQHYLLTSLVMEREKGRLPMGKAWKKTSQVACMRKEVYQSILVLYKVGEVGY